MARDEAYQETERRIKVARQEEATELNLNGMGLTEVPEAIAVFTTNSPNSGIVNTPLRRDKC